MALEKDVITTKLTEEGISEKLGTGLSFETEGELNSWVEDFKTAIPEPSKKLNDYTREELEEISKDQEFKGAKGLQSFIDSVRAKSKTPAKEPIKEPKKDDEPPEWAKQLIEDNQKLKAQGVAKDFDSLVSKLGKESELSETHINRVKKGLKSDSSEADIKAEIVAYKKELFEAGLQEFGTPKTGSKNNVYKPGESLSGKHAAKHKAKHSKK